MVKKSLAVLFSAILMVTGSGPLYAAPTSAAVGYSQRTVAAAGKNFTVNMITVDLSNPEIEMSVFMSGNKLNTTASFSDIVNLHSPIAAVNGNFFNAYDTVKDPIGHIMANGEFLYASTGLTSVGITHENKIIFGRPMVFTKINTADGGAAASWTAFEVNVLSQAGEQSVLYTPARGASVPITVSGYVMTVVNNAISAYGRVEAGAQQAIPENGYVVYFSDQVASTHYFTTPQVGRQVAIQYTPFQADAENFDLTNARQIVSGSPRLVKAGAICEEPLDSGFDSDSRFTTAATPRTAIGRMNDSTLVLVNVSGATIGQLKEIMLNLGCTDALNIDGGASTAMYVNGSFITQPGRELTSTILIKRKVTE